MDRANREFFAISCGRKVNGSKKRMEALSEGGGGRERLKVILKRRSQREW